MMTIYNGPTMIFIPKLLHFAKSRERQVKEVSPDCYPATTLFLKKVASKSYFLENRSLWVSKVTIQNFFGSEKNNNQITYVERLRARTKEQLQSIFFDQEKRAKKKQNR